jgi:hypothetical protein
MGFEVYGRQRTRNSTPSVTINTLGRFSISSSATKMLKFHIGVENVLLMWDKASKQVAIKPILKGDPRAYPLKSYGKKENSGTGFSAVSFLRHINFDFSKTNTFPVEWNSKENMLVFNIPSEFLGLPTINFDELATTGKRRISLDD